MTHKSDSEGEHREMCEEEENGSRQKERHKMIKGKRREWKTHEKTTRKRKIEVDWGRGGKI